MRLAACLAGWQYQTHFLKHDVVNSEKGMIVVVVLEAEFLVQSHGARVVRMDV